MSTVAHIVIVTTQPTDRYEMITDGEVSFDATQTCLINYSDEKVLVTMGISDDVITISRVDGEDIYYLVAKAGECEPFVLHGIPFCINTTKLETKITPTSVDALIEYYFTQNGEKIDELDFSVSIKATF